MTLGKGWRTLALNGAIVVGAAALKYVAGVDWSQTVDPTIAAIIVSGANIGLRFITTTPIGRSS
jgi:Na+-transporting NADH:ubiquinone oxidoreductase subunit NqrB